MPFFVTSLGVHRQTPPRGYESSIAHQQYMRALNRFRLRLDIGTLDPFLDLPPNVRSQIRLQRKTRALIQFDRSITGRKP